MNEAKRYLKQYRQLDLKINRLGEEIERIRDKAESISAWTDGDRVQSSHQPDKIGQVVAELVDKVDEASSELADAVETQIEIDKTIKQVGDERLIKILILKYEQGLEWEKVVDQMHYDRSWIFRLHGRALNIVSEILNKRL